MTVTSNPMVEYMNSLRTQQPFLVDLTTFGTNLTPATAELRAVLGEPTRQAVEAEQHVHPVKVLGHVRPGA